MQNGGVKPHPAADADSEAGLRRHIGLRSATGLVIANIIGAGIFTSTGFQAEALGHPGYIFGLWVTGGILALCGALCYAELGAAMPRAGAEYIYLRETYGPIFGFMTAFVSLVAGFSALCLSQFVPTIYFGTLVGLTMFGGLVGNLIVLPLLLALVERE